MRMLSVFLGSHRRNDPIKLEDPHPIHNYGDPTHSGNAGLDGYSLLSRADPANQGRAPAVKGSEGPAYMGPAEDWEQ
jgi:hypothetical protein